MFCHFDQNRSDLLKSLQKMISIGSETHFLPALSFFLPKIGLSNFFKTLWNLSPWPLPWWGPCMTWFTRGIGAMQMSRDGDLCDPGSDRLRLSMARFSFAACTSKESLSNSSNRVLFSSPNLLSITGIFSTGYCCNVSFICYVTSL